jgi:sulfite exporter TauE/SafE
MLGSFLALGLLLGLKHALEADHLSTVATLATRSSSKRHTVTVAAAWGLGHAAALVVLGGALVALGATLHAAVVRAFELAVGLILIALGFDVLRRLRRGRIHLHSHEHGGAWHLHAHAHAAQADTDRHDHAHGHALLGRSVLIGGVHGLAGSAAVAVLTLPAGSVGLALLYLLVFGAGTVLGMIVISLAVSLPLTFSIRNKERARFVFLSSLSIIDFALGAWIVIQHLPL